MKKNYFTFLVIWFILLSGVIFGAMFLGIGASFMTWSDSVGSEIGADMAIKGIIIAAIVFVLGSVRIAVAYAKFYSFCVLAESFRVIGNYKKEKKYMLAAENLWAKINA